MNNEITTKWLNSVKAYANAKPEGAIVIILKTIKGVDYIEHQPKEFPFVAENEIKRINGKQYLRSNYLMQILERKYSTLFLLPSDDRN